MSSRCRAVSALWSQAALLAGAGLPLLLATGATLAQQMPNAPGAQGGPGFVPTSSLFPGGGSAPPPSAPGQEYEHNKQAISEGQRLFGWMNCSGCHFHGGGGMGPPLMDQVWIYGGRIDQIYESIAQGRPNGMPSWRAKLSPGEIWELAAYVKSLSNNAPSNAPGQVEPRAAPEPVAQADTGPPPATTANPGSPAVK